MPTLLTLLLALPAAAAPLAAPPAPPTAHADSAQEGGVDAELEAGRRAIEAGQTLEALSIAEALEKRDAPAAAYLAGLAFHRMAEDGMRGGGGMVAMHLDDAFAQLSAAVKAAPERFPDAYVKLAECAWHAQELAAGREAAEKAVELQPGDHTAWFWLGRLAFAQFNAAQADESQAGAAGAHLERAVAAFGKSAELLGDPAAPADRAQLALVLWQKGNAHAWREEAAPAAAAYARSLGYDPTQADFGALLGARGEESFLAILEDGRRQFSKRYGKSSPADATLLWWLGWARFRQKDPKGAEEALLESVAKWPAYANAYYYVAHARFQARDYPGSVAALREYFQRDAEGLLAQLRQGGESDFEVLGFLTGDCARARPARNVDAAFLSELRAALRPEDPTTWNDVGLFHRDAGDALRRARDEAKAAERAQHYEKALAAYRRALELSPDDPAYLNDAAVVLHYCLVRDLDEAARMYRRSSQRAEEELARDDLTDELREIYRIALRDSRDNLAKLEKLMRERAEKDPPEKEPSGGGGDAGPR